MSADEPLSFTDEQLLDALHHAPEGLRAQLIIVAMQRELAERRAADDSSD